MTELTGNPNTLEPASRLTVPTTRSARSIRLTDRVLIAGLQRAFSGIERGTLGVTLPSGTAFQLGKGQSGPSVTVKLHDLGIVWQSIVRGKLGVAESYLRGSWDCSDLAELFRIFVDNHEDLGGEHHRLTHVRKSDRRWHRERANTRTGSRRNIAAHYDLGNAFYAGWLDPTMTYSSGIFESNDQSLEDAQHAKYAAVLDSLDLPPGAHVLEVGCGWGGFAEAAGHRGLRVTGITLSQEQLVYANDRIAKAGLGNVVDLRLEDYRDVVGSYDAIVSIEMIEAVGEENWPTYFTCLSERLKPGSRAVLQAITIPEALYHSYRSTPDFIQRYVFPGGMLPTPSHIRDHAAKAGLALVATREFTASYVRTLELWLANFRAAWPEILASGFDERFRRLWEYYLIYCMVGFERRVIDVGFFELRRPIATA
jgi:cyclopropane-fatty-acyl-phospholipid synthase